MIPPNKGAPLKLTHITVFPIKSCSGISLSNSFVTSHGLRGDRDLMLIRQNGNFLSQRDFPKLARIKIQHVGDTFLVSIPNPEKTELKISLPYLQETSHEVSVHKIPFQAFDQGDEAASWFSEFLELECRLVAVTPNQMRKKEDVGTSFSVSCHDSSPVHLVTDATLAALNESLIAGGNKPVSFDRFRANLVVHGVSAMFIEETWKKVRIGEVMFLFRKKTGRCNIPSLNQTTGDKDTEVWKTLSAMRGGGKNAQFGIYLIPQNEGRVHIDDEVIVIE